ncbi:hypothetical protein UFOVP1516_89 [uncultured Caudovirales phage]|uniref:Uncharacterized protein n=1 Tax=uncultured Caudovirales phage TaxID=2100421 RepID=A0A6J7XB07_9CAUD|nr:hypothetical protein UFOVP887_47 [uncultured Caudovirales phage]CAB5226967.1 hypothetical protein UFOVP1516_89 [uncultured Caudovirales phage]
MAFVITKPIEEQKKEFTDKINSDSYDRITTLYPIYLQLNIEREPNATAITTMHTFIDAVRGYANVAKTEIVSSTNIADIRTAYNTFKNSIESLI